MGIERMGKDVPCNIPNFVIMDAGAKWEDWPTDSAQAHVLSLNSREGMEREGKERQREAKRRYGKGLPRRRKNSIQRQAREGTRCLEPGQRQYAADCGV